MKYAIAIAMILFLTSTTEACHRRKCKVKKQRVCCSAPAPALPMASPQYGPSPQSSYPAPMPPMQPAPPPVNKFLESSSPQ